MLCAVKADQDADVLLNALYAKITAKLEQTENPEHDFEDRQELLKRLVASERAWIAYRETECSHASAYMLHGSGENTILPQCRFSMRVDRINTLFRFYVDQFPDIAKE